MAPRRRLSKRRLLLLALAAVAIAVGATRGAASASTPPPGADADPSAGARASPGARHHRPSPASSSLANERPALARPAAGLADPARASPAPRSPASAPPPPPPLADRARDDDAEARRPITKEDDEARRLITKEDRPEEDHPEEDPSRTSSSSSSSSASASARGGVGVTVVNGLEVDASTHRRDEEAAARIARSGADAEKVSGHASRLDLGAPVFATFVSDGFHEFMLNWHARLSALGVTENVIVAALDEATVRLCESEGIPYHSDSDLRYTFDVVATGGQPLHDPTAKVTMEGKAFQQIGALKAAFLLFLLNRGHEVLVSDVDVAWLRDPRGWFASDPVARGVDVAVSTDCLSVAEERRARGCWHMQFNTGVLWLRPTDATKALVAEWRDALLETEDKFEHDQDIFNRLLRTERDGRKAAFQLVGGEEETLGSEELSATSSSTALPLARASRGVTLGALPLTLFAGGHVYFVQRLHERPGAPEPFAVHTTYQFSQQRGKRQRLREIGAWAIDPPEYYGAAPSMTSGVPGAAAGGGIVESSSPRSLKFIALGPEAGPPTALVSVAGIENHLSAAAWYRLTVRNLFAAGQALGRVPIFPRVACACDRYWGNVLPTCAIPGADAKPPFDKCPSDHVFNLPNLERAFGANAWREWSFLENPNVPSGMERNAARVEFAFEDEPNQDDGSSGSQKPGSSSGSESSLSGSGRVLTVPAFPTDAELIAAAGDAEEALLLLSSGPGAFCAFASDEAGAAFDAKASEGLRAESHFCGAGPGGAGRRCEIGFGVPRGTVKERGKCAEMRRRAYEGGGVEGRWHEERFDDIGWKSAAR